MLWGEQTPVEYHPNQPEMGDCYKSSHHPSFRANKLENARNQISYLDLSWFISNSGNGFMAWGLPYEWLLVSFAGWIFMIWTSLHSASETGGPVYVQPKLDSPVMFVGLHMNIHEYYI